MRTSRVQTSTSSLYRQPKLAVQSDNAFQDAYNQSGHHQERHALLNQKKKGKQQRKRAQVSTIKSKMIMKGMQMSGESTQIHNYLIRRAYMVNSAHLMRTRNHTYRTSI